MQNVLTAILLVAISSASARVVKTRWRRERERRAAEQGYRSYTIQNALLWHTTYLFGFVSIISLIGAILILVGYS